ncbi:MAG: phage terminase large subunit [Acidocella sp.]|nr:phage terminase large subunit [Acidocella sp.]
MIPPCPAVAERPLPDCQPNTLLDWARLALPEGMAPAKHQIALLSALADIEAGRTDRLMVLMPPGSAKSTYASVLFPPWWLARRPASTVIACAHTASLAGHFAGRVRSLIADHAEALDCSLARHGARHDFSLASGSNYFAVGVQGAVTGRRADLILIDDPIRSHMEAENHRARERLWDWYRTDLLTRLKPKGRIVLIMTRWHHDDLVARLLARENEWTCLRLPALAEAKDPLGRTEGEALWPEWEDSEALMRKRSSIGEQRWSCLYQQNPMIGNGTMFRISRIPVVEQADPVCCIRGWDLAATSPEENPSADWTVGVKLGRESNGRIIILDVVRLQGRSYEIEAEIVKTAQRDGVQTRISLPQDPGQAGKHQAHYLVRALAGFVVNATRETGSKKVRATPLSCQVDAGNVAMLRAGWNARLLDELADFPLSRNDDQVDALTRAFEALTSETDPIRRAQIALLSR